MSEEQRKQSCEFYHVLAAARDFYANYDGERDFEQGQNVVDFAAAFAAQVCEQSQREIDRLSDTFEDYRVAIETWQRRAEAAELALQKEKSAAEQLRVQLAGCSVAALGWAEGEQRAEPGDYGYSASYQDVIDLRVKWLESELALLKYQQRAKELKLQLGLTEEAHHSDVVAKISKLAQARQQAVAEISKFVRAQEPTLGPHTFSKIQDYLRSLTLPPALTKEK